MFFPGKKAQAPSEPPPKHDSLAVYDEQVPYGMQLSPFETHFYPIPIIYVKQDALIVPRYLSIVLIYRQLLC